MSMRKFTAKSNLNQVLRALPDRKYGFMIRMGNGLAGAAVGALSFERLAKMAGGVWNAESIAEGMTFVVNQAHHRQVFYPIWSEVEQEKDPSKKKTCLAAFFQDKPSKFVVICAGGGYGAVATMQEAFPLAQQLYACGYSVFALQYRTGKAALAPAPMDDLAEALRFIFSHKKEWHIDTYDYALMGFSAGGHLAACFGLESTGYAHYGLPRPGMMILGYPVITMGELTNPGSRKNLLGKVDIHEAKLIERYSIERNISKSFPKTYVWQCDNDIAVPIQNTQMLVNALSENGIPYQYETFPSDAHGWGLGTETPAQGWLGRALHFWHE